MTMANSAGAGMGMRPGLGLEMRPSLEVVDPHHVSTMDIIHDTAITDVMRRHKDARKAAREIRKILAEIQNEEERDVFSKAAKARMDPLLEKYGLAL